MIPTDLLPGTNKITLLILLSFILYVIFFLREQKRFGVGLYHGLVSVGPPSICGRNQGPSTGGQGVSKKVTNRHEHKGVWYLNVISQREHQVYITEDKEVK